jgi:xanthine dehydrogenase YagS FAD-binding subunit
MLPDFAYARPTTLPEALRLLGGPGARPHAGGTDLLGCLRDGVFGADLLVSLGGLDELRGIRETRAGGLAIGALTSIAEIAASERVRNRYPALAEAAASVASPQLRNQGTLGGNLCQKPRCWYYRGSFDCLRRGGATCFAHEGENRLHCILGGGPCFAVHPSDTAPALIALGAHVQLAGAEATRTLPLESFYVPPSVDAERETVLARGEIVGAVELPPTAPGLLSSYRKVRVRGAWDFALASVALAVRFSGGFCSYARVVLGGVAPLPWRSRAAEILVTGSRLDRASIERAAEAALQEAEPLSQNAYKVALTKGLLAAQLAAFREQPPGRA